MPEPKAGNVGTCTGNNISNDFSLEYHTPSLMKSFVAGWPTILQQRTFVQQSRQGVDFNTVQQSLSV